MNFAIRKLPRSEIEIEVNVPWNEFEPHTGRAAVLISEEREFDGFRRGKAPYAVIKEKLGEMAIYERAAELAVRASYPKALEELTARGEISGEYPPIGRPEMVVTKLAPGNDLEYKVKTAVLPKVELPNWRVTARRVLVNGKKEISVQESEVDDTIQWIRESRAPLIIVDRPAQKGDAVEVDFEVRHGGVKVADGESRNHPLVLGKGKFLPGFEDEIIGMKAGDQKQFSLVAPEDWHEKSLVGKSLDFAVSIKKVQERKIPDLNNEFVKSIGNFSSIESLRQSVREGLGAEKQEKEKQRLRTFLIDEIAKEVKIEPPDILISGEIEKMIEELKSGVENMGMKWEDYLLHIKKNMEELKQEWRVEAEKRVQVALCLREIGKEVKIEVGEAEVEARANQYLQQYQTVGEAKKAIDLEALREYTRGILRNEKVFEFLERM